MFAKSGFVLLLYGSLAFLAGANLPESARQQLPALTTVAGKPAIPSAPAAAKPAPAARQGAAPPGMETLFVPANPPTGARYAAWTGLFPSRDAAEALAARIAQLHLPGVASRVLQVRDHDGQDWWIAAAGDKASPQELETLRIWLGEQLALRDLRIILLPPAPKS